MNYYDDATGLPINLCSCGKEVLGWVDDPEIEFKCEECEEKENGLCDC